MAILTIFFFKMAKIYNYLFIESSDPLTREWPLLSSPFSILFIIFTYLYFVLNIGPHIMKERLPYKLKTFISVYNLIQILANLWFVEELISFGWFSKHSIICPQQLNPDTSNLLKAFNCVWWILILKFFDLIETCVFVLRKKQNQISTLHVYHHVSNICTVWIYLKYALDERITFIPLINSATHVIMYVYYFISGIDPKYQQIISPFKPFVTRIQMVQFLVIIVYILQLFHPTCYARNDFLTAKVFLFIFAINIVTFLYLFYDFYKKSYSNASKEKNI